MNKDFGIIICNFNKVDYLKGCLETLYKSELRDLTYDVIVVDNASNDGSAEFIKENYKEIILLQNKENTGGSGGFDRGIKFALNKEYKFVVLLDNDILLEKNTILNLLEYITLNPKVGAVGSKICTMDDPDILQEMGSFIDFENKFNINTPLKSHKDDEFLPNVVVCDYIPACCMITTNEVLKKVGSFNTDHFIYWDDMDWCTRVKRAGYEIHAINNSRVFHKMGAANHTNTFGVYYFERNRIMFFLKYIEENELESFINSICNWLLSVIFFSNLKGNYATPKSLLRAIDDLLVNNLGRQDESIFIKEREKDIFDKYSIQKNQMICLYLQDDMFMNRRIYDYLQEYFDDNIKIYCNHENYELIQNNFDKNLILDLKAFEEINFDKIFYTLKHILDFDKKMKYSENYIFIDEYLNTSSIKDVESILNAYTTYKDIFINIYQPLIEQKLFSIRKNLFKEKDK